MSPIECAGKERAHVTEIRLSVKWNQTDYNISELTNRVKLFFKPLLSRLIYLSCITVVSLRFNRQMT